MSNLILMYLLKVWCTLKQNILQNAFDEMYIQLSMYCIFSDTCLRPKILSFDPAWEPSIYCTRIKSPESNFEAYDFWLAEGTKKLQTLLESYMIQLFKNVSSFSVSLANHKLKKHKCMKPATLPRGFKDFQIAKIPITLEWMMSQKRYAHFWKAAKLRILKR